MRVNDGARQVRLDRLDEAALRLRFDVAGDGRRARQRRRVRIEMEHGPPDLPRRLFSSRAQAGQVGQGNGPSSSASARAVLVVPKSIPT